MAPRVCQRSFATALLVLVASGLVACGGARPYRAMARAASSEERPASQLEDRRLKIRIREAILAADPGKTLDITPYAYMGHAYLVGFADPKDADELVRRVRGLKGVRSVDAYLPTRPASRSAADDLELKAKVKSALALEPGEGVRQLSGVSGVTNLLLVPEAGYESLRPRLR